MSDWRETKKYTLIGQGPVGWGFKGDFPVIWEQNPGSWCMQWRIEGPGAVQCPILEEYMIQRLPDKEVNSE